MTTCTVNIPKIFAIIESNSAKITHNATFPTLHFTFDVNYKVTQCLKSPSRAQSKPTRTKIIQVDTHIQYYQCIYCSTVECS